MKMLNRCCNWKVLAGLVTVGIAIYLVAPNAILRILPILALVACPLSMIVMMFAMRGTAGTHQGQVETQRRPAPQAAGGAPLTRDEQLAQLRSQLLSLGQQQAALAAQIERLETTGPAPNPNGAAQASEPLAPLATPRAANSA